MQSANEGTMDLDALVDAAAEEHRAGRLPEAERLYQAVLAKQPRHWRAANNLGALYVQRKQFDLGLPLLETAAEEEPEGRHAWFTYLKALAGAGRFEQAEALLGQKVGHPRAVEAELRLRQAWGMRLVAQREYHQAVDQLRRAWELAPEEVETVADLGNALLRIGDPVGAEPLLTRAVAKNPNDARAMLNLGSALRLLDRLDEAERIYRDLLARHPGHPGALQNLSLLLVSLGRHEDVLQLAEQARNSAPVFHSLRGEALRCLGRYEEALAEFDKMVAANPRDPNSPYRRAHLRLLLQDFDGGWQDYEARWKNDNFLSDSAATVVPQLIQHLTLSPSRDDILGKRLVLLGEQGLGDQIMFASMLADAARDAASVLCVCDAKLFRLFSHSFPQIEFRQPRGLVLNRTHFDRFIAMGSLGGVYRQRVGDFPGRAYLEPAEAVRQRWAERLGPRPSGLRIGIAWRGGVKTTGVAQRSMQLNELRPLLELPGCEFVNLQYGDVAAEVDEVNATLGNPIRSFAPEDVRDFEEQAGIIANLDLIVSVQQSLVHLAGALGKECLTLIPHRPEWRYTAHSDTMPWYGSVKLFRQAEPGDWRPVIERVTDVLRARLA